MPITDAQGENSQLGKSLHFHGAVAGTGDVVIDGRVEGTIHMPKQCVTIGPHGDVQADVRAREVVVHGRLKGNIVAQDRVEIAKSGSVWGDLTMARVSIQDGAFFQGKVDIRNDAFTPQPARPESANVLAAAAAPGGNEIPTPFAAPSHLNPAPTPAPTVPTVQGSLLESKP